MIQALTRARLAVLVGCAAAAMTAGAAARPQAPPGRSAAAETRIELVAVDKEGRPAESLAPADVIISVDGVPRPVLSIRRVSRGPGAASDAARRQALGAAGLMFAAEPSRNVVVVIDQATLIRGEERTAVQAGGAFLDRLGLGDRVGVLRLPASGDQSIDLTTDRPAVRNALAQVRGLAAPSELTRPEVVSDQAAGDPAAGVNRDRPSNSGQPKPVPAITPGLPAGTPDADPATARGSIAGLLELTRSIRALPGRKVIAIVSPGLSNHSTAHLAETAAAAIAARATVYLLGIPSSRFDAQRTPDVSALQTLAQSTGGAFVMLGRNPGRAIDRVIAELSTIYVVGVEAAPGDGDGRRHPIRVQSTRSDLVLRAPSFLLPAPEAPDVVPASVEAARPPGGDVRLPASRGERPDAGSPASAGQGDLQVALGRMFDYATAYASQYSALVAEEDYQQVTGQRSVRLRSDFLLVRQAATEGWVSFRDVFEVDGSPVRDREDRLRRLFLEPGAESAAQLMRIKDESARYNIGPLERNINVPLYQLGFLRPVNRTRFQFKLAGRTGSAGVQVWHIEFTERDRPTIIRDRQDRDVPAAGYFLVEQGTGAIVETMIRVEDPQYQADIVVKFRLDSDLGMWVPSQMTETYRTARVTTAGWGFAAPAWSEALKSTARYTKFRRFQVKTEETVKIPK